MAEKLKKRGESLVAVLVAMAVISIFGIAAMYIANTNLRMKQVNNKSKNNFYTSESVLNDVTAGLEKLLSDVYTQSYTEVMQKYRSYEDTTLMESAFTNAFVLQLLNKLEDVDSAHTNQTAGSAGESTYYYDLDVVKNYFRETDVKYTDRSSIIIESNDGIDDNGFDNIIETLADGVLLKNIHISYLNEAGYFNEIYTDIKLSVPKLSFSMISTMPNISEYVLIAEGGLKINGGNALQAAGNIYVGKRNSTANEAVSLKANSSLDCTEAATVIANGNIDVGNAARIITGGGKNGSYATVLSATRAQQLAKTASNTSLWTENISLADHSQAYILGRTYVKDDTSVEGSNSTLTLSGQYFGYSCAANIAASSSAIVINGKNTRLNIKGLGTLILGGSAFVGSSKQISSKGVNVDILTGESISIKPNQLAYLVPTECPGVTTNPMSYTQYQALIADGSWQDKILNTNIAALDRTISSYGTPTVVPVFSQKDDGTVYLYIQFDSVDAAANYYMDIFNSNSATAQKLKNYLNMYIDVDALTVNTSSSDMVTEGNYLIPILDGAAVSMNGNGIAYERSKYSVGSIPTLVSNTADQFEALCKKLITTKTSLTAEEIAAGATVFSNIISEEKVRSFINETSYTLDRVEGKDVGAKVIQQATPTQGKVVRFENGSNLHCYIVDNEGKSAYQIGGGNGIIIATGDINISGTWDGIVIAKGKVSVISGQAISPVIITSSSSSTKDTSIIGKVFRMSAGAYTVMNFFKGGESYALSENTGDTNLNYADVRNCVTYLNWNTEIREASSKTNGEGEDNG